MIRSMNEYAYHETLKSNHRVWLKAKKAEELIAIAKASYPLLKFWHGVNQPYKIFIDIGGENISSVLTETIYRPYIGATTGCETSNPKSNPWVWDHQLEELLDLCATIESRNR
jgi:hypothetical protein